MRWLVCAAVCALELSAVAEEPRGVAVLSATHHRGREAVLVDALRIYTRDLGRTVRLGGAPPESLDAPVLERVAAEARRAGDEVVVWFGDRGGAPVLHALKVATFELRETAVSAEDPSQSARTLALKVRALLTPHADERGWSVPPEAPPPVAAPTPPESDPRLAVEESPEPPATTPTPPPPEPVAPPAPTPPPPAPAPVVTAPLPAPTTVHAAAPSIRRRTWLEATVAYGATVPTQTAWVRHGLTVRLAVPWGRLPLEAFADTAFTTEPTATVDGNTVAARVWPVGAGVAWRLRRPKWGVTVGPRVSLQIVDADARAPDGRDGAARRYSAGLGVLGEAAWLFSSHVGAIASVSVEALVPRLEFGAGGAGTTDLGFVQFGFTGGLIFSIP